ncbi:MAG: hypothetical protein MUF49_07310 [Oculatellaceae cyanobacterium Prado106]|jgi:hypothetical protein|nr:hypothetical protein [Oculatellaceae cyanobacterium Prado106]
MMTKPDFNQMTRKELRTYILANREEDEAIEALIRRPNPNSRTYSFPLSAEDLKEIEAKIKRKQDDQGAV